MPGMSAYTKINIRGLIFIKGKIGEDTEY